MDTCTKSGDIHQEFEIDLIITVADFFGNN